MSATCNTCPWWSRLTYPQGECRNRSPICHPEAAYYQGFADHIYGMWPKTNGDDWCGEHPDRRQP